MLLGRDSKHIRTLLPRLYLRAMVLESEISDGHRQMDRRGGRMMGLGVRGGGEGEEEGVVVLRGRRRIEPLGLEYLARSLRREGQCFVSLTYVRWDVGADWFLFFYVD